MSVRLPSRRVSPAERRADLWLALALFVGAMRQAREIDAELVDAVADDRE